MAGAWTSMMRTYTELIQFLSFEERLEYAILDGNIGEETFGHDRYLNQMLYHSKEWRRLRREIIIRDHGMDLAFDDGTGDYEIEDKIIIHHLNPITIDDVLRRAKCVFDPENVVCVSDTTHKAIHYSTLDLAVAKYQGYVERKPNDTKLW